VPTSIAKSTYSGHKVTAQIRSRISTLRTVDAPDYTLQGAKSLTNSDRAGRICSKS
jgi:hypothetical protein